MLWCTGMESKAVDFRGNVIGIGCIYVVVIIEYKSSPMVRSCCKWAEVITNEQTSLQMGRGHRLWVCMVRMTLEWLEWHQNTFWECVWVVSLVDFVASNINTSQVPSTISGQAFMEHCNGVRGHLSIPLLPHSSPLPYSPPFPPVYMYDSQSSPPPPVLFWQLPLPKSMTLDPHPCVHLSHIGQASDALGHISVTLQHPPEYPCAYI
jgi:hypothetical protein